MTYETIRYEAEGPIATITLNRPEKLNAYTARMGAELADAIVQTDEDDAIRAVILTGEGRGFCAGADISAGANSFDTREGGAGAGNFGGGETRRLRGAGGGFVGALFNAKKATITAFNGPAVGVGVTLALPTDIKIASSAARFGFVFARRGIVPEACSSWFLPRIVGTSKAAEWLFTGRVFRAGDEAHSGLFNFVLPSVQVLSKAQSLAREIADNTSATSVALTKALLYRGLADPNPETAHLNDSRCIYWAGMQKDAQEGITSFLEKRPAAFGMSAAKDMPEFYPWWIEPKL